MNETDRQIRAMKKRNRKLFRKIHVEKNTWLDLVYGMLLSSTVVGAVAEFSGIASFLLTPFLSLMVTLLKQLQEKKNPPERFRANELFVGLHSGTGESESANGSKAAGEEDATVENGEKNGFERKWYITRDREVGALKLLVEKDFRTYKTVKKGICLVGASGCGKSILLEMLKADLAEEQKYDIREYFSAYYDLKSELWAQDISSDVDDRMQICIFDQFEQVLQLDERSFIFQKIRFMREQGAMLIFSLREEYLRAFVGEWLMGESPADYGEAAVMVQYLVTEEPEKVTEEDLDTWKKKEIWEDLKKKDENNTARSVPDIIMVGGKNGKHENLDVVVEMLERCEKIEEYGVTAWEKVEDRSLIEQQIILNMMSQPEKLPVKAINGFADCDYPQLMKAYYDVQLSSTGEYFMACRILYFLSQARVENHDIYQEVLQEAVCIAGGQESERFEGCLQKLKEMCLIKGEQVRNVNLALISGKDRRYAGKSREKQKYVSAGRGVRYEIAHDFVAQSFLAYANQALPPNVRAALDDYRATHDLSSRNRSEASGAWRAYTEKGENSGWITVVWIISLVAVLLRFAAGQMVENYEGIGSFLGNALSLPTELWPDTETFDHMISRTGSLSIAVVILTALSLFYIYNFYRNITQFYGIGFYKSRISPKKTSEKRWRRWVVAALYILAMCAGVAAACAGERWLFFLGLGNLLNGVACIWVSLDDSVAPNGRGSYMAYGVKTAICSMLMMTGSLSAAYMETSVSYGIDMKELIQEWIMATLLLYSYHQHLEQKFIYVHVLALMHGEKGVVRKKKAEYG